jgi:hypothetical protein
VHGNRPKLSKSLFAPIQFFLERFGSVVRHGGILNEKVPKMQSSRPPVRYKLSQPVNAVKLEEHPGSKLRNPTTTLMEIPPDVVVELEGAVAPSGLVNVLWDGVAFSVFYEDLREKAQILAESGA